MTREEEVEQKTKKMGRKSCLLENIALRSVATATERVWEKGDQRMVFSARMLVGFCADFIPNLFPKKSLYIISVSRL